MSAYMEIYQNMNNLSLRYHAPPPCFSRQLEGPLSPDGNQQKLFLPLNCIFDCILLKINQCQKSKTGNMEFCGLTLNNDKSKSDSFIKSFQYKFSPSERWNDMNTI